MAGDGPNRFLIESIGRINPQILSIQQREFHTALGGEGDSEIVCFYETVESPTAQKDKHGNWAMTGPTVVLVTKPSATNCRSWEDDPEHICAVARTHSNMVKFGPQDHEYDNAYISQIEPPHDCNCNLIQDYIRTKDQRYIQSMEYKASVRGEPYSKTEDVHLQPDPGELSCPGLKHAIKDQH
ncbi:hypothetical protein QQX98_012694 [Neonectria punicea]|uniref:Uncharacterized protein n=1 Tax=Neonectria punicea TaxID=979145 RepID=A0ABR1GIJ3_9HYPO